MTIIKYTPEQHDVLDHMESEDGILLVSAGAGTGKSFMAKQVAHQLQPRTGLYTAFNKAIVEEGNARFQGTNMECRTLHALAYKYVRPTQEIHDISYSCIKENIAYAKKYELITAINLFFVSASTDMYDYMEERFEDHDEKRLMADLATKYIEKMIAGELNPTFNFLLKYFHLMLVEGTVRCEYDLVILDEINDTTAVALEIFKLIKAPKKLGLGETNQAIYDFLNLVDGFELLENEEQLQLTHSWRCSEKIAKDIQTFMRREVSDKFTFVGTNEPVRNNKSLFCTMTNAKIIAEIENRLSIKQGFYLLRKISEIFALPLAIVSAGQGKKPYQKRYNHLAEEYENYLKTRTRGETYLQHLLAHFENDQEIKTAVNLLLSLQRKNVNIFDLYSRAKNAEVDLNYTIATVYTSKGLEFETVTIADDLNGRIMNIRDNGGIQTHEDLVAYRCYYVAASRAGVNLHNAVALRK
jgi:superfamily I DNA/RNA helicase